MLTPRGELSGVSSTNQVNWGDAIDGFFLPDRNVGYVLRRSTCPISFLFRTYSYPGRRQETCPRGKRVCSKEKLRTFFVADWLFAPTVDFKPAFGRRAGSG
jgi:hypothetical protein